MPQATTSLTAEHRREFQRWFPHLVTLVQLEYRPTGQKTWQYRCTSCQASARSHRLALARHHHVDCYWLKAWNSLPEIMHYYFFEYWKSLSPEEQFKMRDL